MITFESEMLESFSKAWTRV